jgi:outer membrane protein assembly factor BamA
MKLFASSLICLSLFSLFPMTARAADGKGPEKSGIVPIPALYYTPETALAAGGLLIYYFRNDDDPEGAKPSQIKPLVITTQKKQLITSLLLSRRWNGGKDHLSVFSRYRRYPDKIWGTGPDTTSSMEEDYSANLASVEVSWERALDIDAASWLTGWIDGWSAGPVAVYGGYKITKKEAGGLVADGDLTGAEGSRTGGFGILMSRDTRDNLFAAAAGVFDSLRIVHVAHLDGDHRPYDEVQFEARRYFSVADSSVLVARLFAQGQDGDVPFRDLSSLGGPDRMRGYYEGRYRDKFALIGEGEYRFPVWWRLRGAVFASAGNVAGKMNDITSTPARYSVGGGVRAVVDERERIAIRVDYGKTPESEGLYVQLNEAF